MNPAAWERAKSLLAEAATLPAEDRARFVVEHCPDPELRREVLDMLASPAPLSEIIATGALASGDRLGPYVIDRVLGRGGMGVVYRARDTRLDRTVAIKVLPPALSADPARRERFDREAHAVAALDDPHICTLYDVGRDNGIDFLVMQYLEGETLAARLARGRLPLDEVLRLAHDIATALDRAHRTGVVHRDLKPANIMVTKAGAVLLDFGLARLTPSGAGSLSTAPTAPATLTAEGTLIGTLHYMSPEQLEGREADARSDIFAFGAVLYEMATGQKAFDGDSHASIVGAVLKDQPPSIAQHEPMAPPELDRLVRTCLEKNPDERFQSLHDVVIALDWVRDAAQHPSAMKGATHRRLRRWLVPLAVSLIVAAAAVAALAYLGGLRRSAPGTPPAVRFDLAPPAGWKFDGIVAVSPDGRHIVGSTSNDKGAERLWLRTLGDEDGRWLTGTDNAANPFWAPDSSAIGFFADGKLKRLDLRNLSMSTICDAPNSRGGAWTSDNQMVFAPGMNSGLARVPATGGNPVPLTSLAAGEISHRFPAAMPNRQLTYQVLNQNREENGTWLLSLDNPHGPHRIVRGLDRGIVADDSLFWTTDDTLLTQRLDPSTGRLIGDPATVATRVSNAGVQGLAAFSVSSAGVLAFRSWAPPSTQLTWVARNGDMIESVGDVAFNSDPRLSPDGRRLAYSRLESGRSDLWIVDVEGHSTTRLVSEQSRFGIGNVEWSRDGRRISYESDRGATAMPSLYIMSATGGQSSPLLGESNALYLAGWTPDGKTAIFEEQSQQSRVTGQVGGRFAIRMMGPDRKAVTIFDPGYLIEHATLSPDGRWIAYSSDQFGRREVFVIGFPEPGTPQQVSLAGGTQPRWRGDGKELFFLSSESKLMAVGVQMKVEKVPFGRPEPLFDAPMRYWVSWPGTEYDVSSDGTRFLINAARDEHASPLTVIVNWSKFIQRH